MPSSKPSRTSANAPACEVAGRTVIVTLHVFRVPPRRLPLALARVALDRSALRGLPGVRFAKVLGTGDGATMRLRDATPDRWALLLAWAGAEEAARFPDSEVCRRWAALAGDRWAVTLHPLSSRGRWSGRVPFGEPVPDPAYDGPVAAITRARLRLRTAPQFWRAVPAVAGDLRGAKGLRLAMGIGEAPVGLQGTFSIWEDQRALQDFAYGRPSHRAVISRTREEGWYAEELFARFAVVDGPAAVHVATQGEWAGSRS